ncbi:MAG: UTP--glucose-1-phosphate uridylyltransferase GalU [Methanosphaera sp.]|uniref:UTP--glucose-1-phosphate uridylyltransferase GalU n=1 Tax=Methanosphaera TaxID=2316 RepID=UPI002380510C|nr:UTP--glucose-1-phosphate uridylyltransferase GalU [Candidatus Methanosphaera massiliense]MDD6285437.1 UTP--glucose-1-phosphate uridylyltransferase GalU [Methanobacteriaceae archaeon]MDE4077491.1 UTP--glucose-1-phosphate uridylyltransferase GalU [Candidatus Methanosphaera massiliense]MDY2745089.1 UTP--glucose-1-phosphate uridylyltransferase GalU [Methanosphaera sp.]
MKAVIPAAGLGTRFLPATKAQPKEMLPVFNKPTIQYVVEEAVNSGIDDILIITGKGKRSIEDHFDRSFELEYHLNEKGKYQYLEEVQSITDMADIYYVRQKRQKGLGDAVSCAKKHIGDEPFAVLLGDTITYSQTPCIKQLLNVYNKYGGSTIAIEELPEHKIERYGIVDGSCIENNIYKVDNLVEKPKLEDAPSNLGITGRYILTPDIFDQLDEIDAGVGGEIQLTDAINNQENVYATTFEGTIYDIGNTIEWLKSSIDMALTHDDVREDIINHMKQKIKEYQ